MRSSREIGRRRGRSRHRVPRRRLLVFETRTPSGEETRRLGARDDDVNQNESDDAKVRARVAREASVILSRPTDCLSSGLGLFLFARRRVGFAASSSKRNERASLDEKRTRDVPLYEPFDERSRVGLLSLLIPLIFTRRVDRLGDARGDGHLDAASAHDVRQLARGALRRAHARL